ncbi:MAG: hypothetical protein ACK47B_28185 [Armatimonadota bacterium]
MSLARLFPLALLAASGLFALRGGQAAQARPASIWIEGESAVSSRMTHGHPWYARAVKPELLSGGDWLTHWDAEKPGQASYRVQAAEGGRYHFWLRANPVQARLRYRLGGGEWREVPLNAAVDRVNVANDGKPDLRFLGWIPAGPVELPRGASTLELQAESGNHHHGAIDALVFTRDAAWEPKGTAKPGAAPVAAEKVAAEGAWAFQPEADRFSPDALLDLRSLNETVAGQHGFIRRSADGRDFVRGDGQPIRFWAVGSTVYRQGPRALADHARFLAKRGVNMVRWHGQIPLQEEGGQLGAIDEKAREELWQYVAAMKKEGIYVTVSPYYPHATKVLKSWGVDSPQKNTTGLLFFDPKVQAAYKSWLRQLFEPKNPHTGVALKDEPAVALVQIQNEDSLLFWTFNEIAGAERLLLHRKFGQWLHRKYGSTAAARQAWEDQALEGDDWTAGVVAIGNLYDLTTGPIRQFGPPQGGRAKRLADQAEFLTETMRAWNAEVVRFLRDEIGAKQLVNAGNWKTADPVLLNDLERYSYTATDVIGVNRYYNGGVHEGEHNGWAIVNGDRFSNESVVRNPRELPVSLKQVAGHPMIISESLWVPPLGYQSEAPFLVSAYQSLNGVDAFYWFNIGESQWREPSSANGYLPSLGKWVANTPELLGNFPAAALIFRRGYVAQGRAVVQEKRALADLWTRRVPLVSEEGTYDPNRDRGSFAPALGAKTQVDQLAFLVGPVEVEYGADPAGSKAADLGPYLDHERQVVRSNTGQLAWDYGQGIVTLDAPKAQGVTGFLSARKTFELSDVTLTSTNHYASVTVVSLDDRPLKEAKQVLVQVGTEARPRGWAQKPVTWKTRDGAEMKGFEIVSYGEKPWLIQNAKMQLSVRNPHLTRMIVLDVNGVRRSELPLQRSRGTVTLTLPKDAKYVVLE